MRPHRPISPTAVGVLLGLAAALCLSTQDLFVKLAATKTHILQIVFLRSVFAFAAAALWVRTLGGGWTQLAIRAPRLVAIRITCNMAAWFCYYAALPHLSLPVYTSIGFTVFLFSALLSGPALKEPLTWREWLAAAAGMTGVLLIADPFSPDADPNPAAMLLLLFGAFMWAVSIVVTRALGATMTAGGIMFYSNLGLLLIGSAGIAAAPAVWHPPTADMWLLFICIGAMAFLGQNLMITAVQFTRIATVTPTQYTMLLWATLYGYLIWDSLPGPAAIAGAALIIAGGFLTLKK